jgi:uncharacterized protein YbjT (DUF2867 family)
MGAGARRGWRRLHLLPPGPGRAGGELYELTGPRSITFAEAAAEIAAATGGELSYTPVSFEQHEAELAEHGVPRQVIEMLTYLFGEVVDGRNADTTDGVERALGREAADFRDYAESAAASGVWSAPGDVNEEARG